MDSQRALSPALRELPTEVAERIAELVVRSLGGESRRAKSPVGQGLIDANEVARILGCHRGWVYEHKDELGAIKLGGGARPRLRFSRARVEAIGTGAEAEGPTPPSKARRRPARRRRTRLASVKLLEIKGQAP
jgi:hypothetical protein